MSNEKKEKKTLIESFEGLTDPRTPDDILHKLIDIVAITILAMICGANGRANASETVGVGGFPVSS